MVIFLGFFIAVSWVLAIALMNFIAGFWNVNSIDRLFSKGEK